MATTQQYLEELITQKNNLVSNLVSKGVDASNDETFTTLVPKINDIPSGGDIEEYFDLTVEDIAHAGGQPIGWSCWYNAIKKLPTFIFNGTNCEYMFYFYPANFIDLSKFNTSNVTNMGYMFAASKLISVDLSNLDTSNVTNMMGMFSDCSKLISVDLSNLDTSNVTDMMGMFNSCSIKESVDLSNLDTSNVTNISSMFYQTSIANINLSGCDFNKVINVNNMMRYNYALTNLIFGINLGKGYIQQTANYSKYMLNISDCSQTITYESLMDIINKLYDLNLTYDVANGGTLYTQKLVLGSTNLAKLTAEEIAIATNKGWTVS